MYIHVDINFYCTIASDSSTSSLVLLHAHKHSTHHNYIDLLTKYDRYIEIKPLSTEVSMITFRCEPDCVLTNMTTPKNFKHLILVNN